MQSHILPDDAGDISTIAAGKVERCRQVTRRRSAMLRLANFLPGGLRESFAERWLRRADTPAPAVEHAFQYMRDVHAQRASHPPATVRGADNFYRRQYRQYLNPVMGVFAMTARMAVLAAGGPARGLLWARRRRVAMTMAETFCSAPPILVLDHQTVAAALFLPRPTTNDDEIGVAEWIAARGPLPPSYARLVQGKAMNCAEPGVRGSRRPSVGAKIELADAALISGKLAILALSPYDPDAMGLHLTLFGVEAVDADRLEQEYGLEKGALDLWRGTAAQSGKLALFLVGGVEEAFTQCSQNLFIKSPRLDLRPGQSPSPRWTPLQPIDRLLGNQFELMQATVSASGLPGVSPRNGEFGLAAFSARRGRKSYILIPYFAGNAVHGHAAKIWSNAWASLLVWDDHHSLTSATISGPARIIEHADVTAGFPHIAEMIGARRRRSGAAADDPEYWFEQEVAEIRLQDEPIAANRLDPARAPCSLSAGGLAHHGKKPGYFDASSLPIYDMNWQHEREAMGRPIDPTGVARRYWQWESSEALALRRAHLARYQLE